MNSETPQFVLRDYQEDAVNSGFHYLKYERENSLLVLPTGSGKSLVIAALVQALGEPCLVFQPSKEILDQNYQKFLAYGIEPAVYSASAGRKEVGAITLATIGSVKKSPEMFAHVKYVLVDEAHGCNAKQGLYKDFFAALGNKRLLGLTATPYRLSTDGYGGSILKFLTRTRPRVFTHVAHVVQNGDLFRDGYLAKLVYKSVKGMDKSLLKLNSTGADYTDKSVMAMFKVLNWGDRVVEQVEELFHSGRKNALVFCRFLEEAQYITQKLPHAAMVSSESSKDERERILREFKSGKIKCVVNVGVLVVGFDFPALEAVTLAAPTMSLARYYQMVGRCVRTSPEKKDSCVVDMVGSVEQFGRVEDLHLRNTGNGKWIVQTGGRQLTNMYFGDVYQKPGTGAVPRVTEQQPVLI